MCMKQRESKKRILVLLLAFVGLCMQTAVYAWFWFNVYYPQVSKPRFSVDGYALGNGLKLYFRGHLLILAIYFILLLFFSNTYGGLKIGYLRPMDVFFSQIFGKDMIEYVCAQSFQEIVFGFKMTVECCSAYVSQIDYMLDSYPGIVFLL